MQNPPQNPIMLATELPSEEHAICVANILLDEAESTLKEVDPKGSIHRRNAALRNAEDAISQAKRLVEGRDPDSEPTLSIADLLARARDLSAIRATAQEGAGEATGDAALLEWWGQTHQQIFNLEIMLRIQYNSASPPSSETEREARCLLAEQLQHRAAKPDSQPRPEHEDREFVSQMTQLQEEASGAQRATVTAALEMLERFDETLVLDISPRLKEKRDVAIRAGEITCSPSSLLIGIVIDDGRELEVLQAEEEIGQAYRQNRPAEDTPSTAALEEWVLPFVIFAHNGRKVVKHITEPYPKGFPASTAAAHMAAASLMMRDALQQNGNPPPGTIVAESLINDMRQAALNKVHDLTPQDLSHMEAAMKQKDVPKGARIAVFKAIFNWDYMTAAMVTKNHNPEWRRQLDQEASARIVSLARQEGMDPHAIQSLCHCLGYPPESLGAHTVSLDPTQLDTIAMEARTRGISEEAIVRIAQNV